MDKTDPYYSESRLLIGPMTTITITLALAMDFLFFTGTVDQDGGEQIAVIYFANKPSVKCS